MKGFACAALAALGLAGLASAAQAADYQFHHRVKGLVVAPAAQTPEPSCVDPMTAAPGTRGAEFCGHEGQALILAGTVGGHAVLFGMNNDSEGVMWGYEGEYIENTGIPNCSDNLTPRCSTLTDGPAYTAAMMANPAHDSGAAKVCADKGPGWYLPALAELHLLWQSRAAIDLASIGLTPHLWYWSSNENQTGFAHGQTFDDGDQTMGNPQNKWAVRCARRS